MIVTLIKKDRIFNITLPEKIKGRFWITDCDGTGKKRNLISVEAVDDKWVLKGSEAAFVFDVNKGVIDEVTLEEHYFYTIKIADDEDAYIYAEAANSERQIFNKFIVADGTEISIGRERDNQICVDNRYVSAHHAVLNYVDNSWTISDSNSTNGTFVNNMRVGIRNLKPGDTIFIIGFKIIIGGGFIAFNNPDNTVRYDTNFIHELVMQEEGERIEKEIKVQPDFFYRAPRFKRDIETLRFKIDGPPSQETGNNLPLPMVIGPSLTMGMASMTSGAFSVINSMNSGGTIMNAIPTLAMSASMVLGMVMWPILTKKYESKKSREKEAERQKLYKDYLFSIRDVILREEKLQTQILKENNISVDEAVDRIVNRQSNLWERTIDQSDFLSISLGNGNIPMQEDIQFPDKRFAVNNDNLLNDMFALANEPRNLEMVPVAHSFKENRITGIIGQNRNNTYSFVMSLLIKMAALHSYDELKFVFIVKENETDYWNPVKWFPHTWNNEHKIRYFASDAKEAKEISSALEQEFYDRQSMKKDDIAVPYYLIIATDKNIAEKTDIYRRVIETGENRGYSIINLYDEFRMLPKETVSVIEIDGASSKIYAKKDISGNAVMFDAEDVFNSDIRTISKALANTSLDLAGEIYEMPDMVTFLEMFGVSKIEHLNSLMRWKANDPTVSLSTPVGVDTAGELFTLDLHEKYQGPHGLVAGMTGSGKSEFIITYILSMAVNFHPDEVAFILIDYKGGGLTGAFEDKERGVKLPHLAGTITNLDGASVKRSLVSIQSELRRRQAAFNEARKASNEGTMDIYKYQKLYREKVVNEPIPHLFIISDEFAELKTQQPEFMQQLISAARIGRSLGVHLILATQKPSGVVDDQIWSNTRFRVCLKVQDKSDSNDMIKRPDAAELSHTGRFYLQVGFNEFFAKGQSAWCGATYCEDGTGEQKEAKSVKVIDNTGRIVKQVKEKKQNVSGGKKTKQIVAIVKYLSDLAGEENIYERPLWLDEIPPVIYTEDLIHKYGVAEEEPHVLEPVVGEIDDPFNQSQSVFRLPITEGGNTIIYGIAGSGKLTFINTMVYELIRHHSAEYLNIYILDFGSETLKMYENAPQVGGVVLSSEKEKVINLMKMLKKEVGIRKKDFAEYGGDYQSYIKNAKKSYPNMVVIINNYAAFSESYEECEEVVAYVTREGTKYGMYFIVTANNSGAVRFRLVQNFKNIYVMQMNDKDDYTGILGSVEGTYPSKYKGRGLLKTEHTYEFQTAVFATPDDTNNVVRELIDRLRKDTSCHARKIPVLPKRVDANYFKDIPVRLDRFTVGINVKNLEPANINIRDSYVSFALSNDLEQIAYYAQGMAEIMTDWRLGDVRVIDSSVAFLPDDCKKYLYCAGNFEDAVVELFNEVLRRHRIYKDSQDMGEEKHLIYIIYGFSKLLTYLSDDGKDKLKVAIEKGKSELRVSFVLMDEGSQMSKQTMDAWYRAHCGNASGLWIGDGSSEQYILKITKMTNELYQEMEKGLGVFISKGRYSIVKCLTAVGAPDDEESE